MNIDVIVRYSTEICYSKFGINYGKFVEVSLKCKKLSDLALG